MLSNDVNNLTLEFVCDVTTISFLLLVTVVVTLVVQFSVLAGVLPTEGCCFSGLLCVEES